MRPYDEAITTGTAAQRARASAFPSTNPSKILLVDDNPPVRSLAAMLLKSAGHHVEEADCGTDALTISERLDSLDLLISDVMLPGIKGPELGLQIMARHPGANVLFFSGYPREQVLGSVEHLSGLEFLQKPFTPMALLQKVADLLASGTGAAWAAC